MAATPQSYTGYSLHKQSPVIYFLDVIEKTGLPSFISGSANRWKMQNFTPGINVNLNPRTLTSGEAIKKICTILRG